VGLISANELAVTLRDVTLRDVTLLDVRWELATGAQPDAYSAGHIPGAVFIDLERDLAAPPGAGGRHPLPDPDSFTMGMRRAGVAADRPVVLYDDGARGMAAARGWWVLRYYGHPDVRVLDGGLAAWLEAGGALTSGDERPATAGTFTARPGHMPVLDAHAAAALPRTGVLLDARAPERYRGDTEPIDPVAGHIPGARNSPVRADSAGRFQGAPVLDVDPGTQVGVYCGSGVSAAHKVLELELAGIHAALYPGSWSEWITDPKRPVATGDEP
jgi:thiosulfate/3-mercaptopyruvate sulfurtransferase